jgi:hypothetical protein
MFNLKGPNGISAILKINLDLETGNFLEGKLIPVRLLNGGIPEYDPVKEGVGIVKQLIENSRFNFNIHLNEEGRLNRIPGLGDL